MEKYSFLKYVKSKEKIYRHEINDLERQLGGASTVDLKSIQLELLKTKMKLDDIKSRKVDSLIDPYTHLKDMIDKINLNIQAIDDNVSILNGDSTETAKQEIINKIRDINIVLDADPKDYTKMVSTSKINYVGERLNPQQITTIMDKYIVDTQALIEEAKSKLGGGLTGKDTLINNEDFQKIFDSIGAKVKEFDTKVKPFKELESKLNEYLENMESLFDITLDEKSQPQVPDGDYLIDVDTLDEEKAPELKESDYKLINESKEEINSLLSTGFLNPSGDSSVPEYEVEEVENGGTGTATPRATTGIAKGTHVDNTTLVQQQPTGNGDLPLQNPFIEETGVVNTTGTSTGQNKGVPHETVEKLGPVGRRGADIQSSNGTQGNPGNPGNLTINAQSTQNEVPGGVTETNKQKGVENKYLSMNNKYIQEPKLEKITVTDESVNQNMNDLYKGWTTKMTEYKSYLTHKKENIDKAIKYSKIIDTLSDQLIKIIEINNLLKISNEKTETLKRDVDYKKTYYDDVKKNTLGDVEIKDLEEDYGKADLLEIQKEITDKVANIKKNATTIMDSINKLLTKGFLKHFIQPTDELTLKRLEKEISQFTKSAFLSDLSRLPNANYKELTRYIEEIKQNQEIENKLSAISFNKKYLSTNVDTLLSLQLGGATHIHQVIEQLTEYEGKVRNMKQIRRNLELKIKNYNIRYVQYYNFQKYIVNYVSLKVAQGGYSYYQFVGKGLISYYQSLLDKLYSIINKFDNFKENSTDPDVQKSTNKWIYGKHYFMIKILKNFFDQLYIRWDKEQNVELTANKGDKVWDLNSKQFKTDAYDKKYWFLFNIFFDILDVFSMNLPAIANYIRINRMKPIVSPAKTTFVKGTKHTLNQDELNKCKENGANDNAADVSQIKFEEVFDPDNFAANDSLSNYMGLSNFLKRGKSIMILTYGYSGVGKSFTLFGKKPETGPVMNGMLQATLKYLGNSVTISVKAFELYGLGVPYKFYWKDPTKFSHFIYSYRIMSDQANIQSNVDKIDKDGMENFLDRARSENYDKIGTTQIDGFSNIVEQIDKVRKRTGRIKATVNNPESSRSIMIYDFKIRLPKKTNDKLDVHFVVMDLPGKENLFQTYSETADPNFDIADNYTQFKDNISSSSNTYNNKLLKTMFYMNPLWLGLIPETAMAFDEDNKGKHLTIRDPVGGKDSAGKTVGKPITVYGIYRTNDNTATQHFYDTIYTRKNKTSKSLPDPTKKVHFTKVEAATDHLQFQTVGIPDGERQSVIQTNAKGEQLYEVDDYGVIDRTRPIKLKLDYGRYDAINRTIRTVKMKKALINICGLRGLTERAMFKIVNLIKSGQLFELGNKLNLMLKSNLINIGTEKEKEMKTNIQLNYGYAGLEGVYINENILGLLQVLANRVRTIRSKDPVPVVCEQIENYRKKIAITEEKRIVPIDINILNDNKSNQINIAASEDKVKSEDKEKVESTIDENQAFFVEDDEFYSQIVYMRQFYQESIGGVDIYTDLKAEPRSSASIEEIEGDDKLSFYTRLREEDWITKNNVLEVVNNYDYNKIFNIQDPPIKKILNPYLSAIDNFYLFFVVSNNMKSAKGGDIETCDKQMKLLYDTKTFMNVISAEDDKDLKTLRCTT